MNEATTPPESTEPEQTVPPELIRSLYIEQLEIRDDQHQVEAAQRAINDRADALREKYLALFRERGLDPGEFTINMKSGKITRKPAGALRIVPQTSAPEKPATP